MRFKCSFEPPPVGIKSGLKLLTKKDDLSRRGLRGGVAQLVERASHTRRVRGSNPFAATSQKTLDYHIIA